ncbi:MAG: DnaA/Hda family protein [Salibaculum sp.]|jgi:chromosomal replication initiation ATPase DnaA|uniref:DnaA ATPase domain-containing protein n=1 Tax=Salibaculum sp. TaxID=2855480 RepID=UPI0028707C52|nr:DnaA/Hda family protein [Salibaculum sp.]MDR9427051.1 DnaA/Hda family protein [Salibaculum sp.]MDR9481950.1 DnaA/Hda family protein [Salibaculum sp.]
MAEQLTFDWPRHIAMGAETFFVSEANAEAYALVTAPAGWPDAKLAVTGPPGAGKTHLARLFADQSGAAVLNAAKIDPAAPLPDGALVIEDGETLPQAAQEWLFHAHNHLRARALPLLLTGQTPPNRWPITLPDLASRLSATTCVTIADPDDRLLDAVLMKQFQDRQIAPTPEALALLRKHIDRTFEGAIEAVAALDQAAMEDGHAVNRALVLRVLDIPPRQG